MKNKLLLTVLLCVELIFASHDKYRLTLRDNPSSSIVIGWNQIGGHTAKVYYSTHDYGEDYTLYDQIKEVDRKVRSHGMNTHFVRLEGLQPNTNYYFVIRDIDQVSRRFWFKTTAQDKSRLSFIAGGDSRNNRIPRQKANRLVAKLKPTAVLFGGDMTDNDTASEWMEWFDDWQLTIASDGRMFPVIAARGNHESRNETLIDLFDVPSNGVYYAITFGDNLVRTYTLNSLNTILGGQNNWLRDDLRKHQHVHFKIAQYHFPIQPHTRSKADNLIQYANWAELFYDYRVNLVVECDAHTVKSTWPLRPSIAEGNEGGYVRDDERGTVFVGEGCWGAPLRENDDDKSWTRNSGTFNQFKWIFVDETKIETRTVKVDNEPQVQEVSNENVFDIPENLDIWKPSNGSVITIVNRDLRSPEIKIISPANGSKYQQGETVYIQTSVSDNDGQIDRVEFYNGDVLLGVDRSAPYEFKMNFHDPGVFLITAKGFDNHELCQEDQIQFNVGDFMKTIEVPITNGDDDVEENRVGGLYTDSSDLELVYDTNNVFSFQKVGLRFREIDIPKGAFIENAYIQFTADEDHDRSAELEFSLHASGNSPRFSNDNNVSDRLVVSDKVIWRPAAWLSGQHGEFQKTPNLSGMIQQVVDRANWNIGNNMSFIIKGRGRSSRRGRHKRVADSYEGNKDRAPKLVVSYRVDYDRIQALTEAHKMINSNFNKQMQENDQIITNFESVVKVYPLPFKDRLNLKIPQKYSQVMVQLFTTNGQQVFESVLSIYQERGIVYLATQKKGVYI